MFSNIIGHKKEIIFLENLINQGTLKGSFLFNGPVGVGKYKIANTIGRYLNCLEEKEDSCFCINCRNFPNVIDYLEINKGENDVIGVDDIVKIEDFINLFPVYSNVKVVVVNNAHNLNTYASNKLLKILEEISSNKLVILITHSLTNISPPLLSRCYRINFSSLNEEEILTVFNNNCITVDNKEFFNIIPYLTESFILNYPDYVKYINEIPAFLKSLKNNIIECLIMIKDIDKEKKLNIFLDIFRIYLLDFIKIDLGISEKVLIKKSTEVFSKQWKKEKCSYLISKIDNIKKYMGYNVNLDLYSLFLPLLLEDNELLKEIV